MVVPSFFLTLAFSCGINTIILFFNLMLHKFHLPVCASDLFQNGCTLQYISSHQCIQGKVLLRLLAVKCPVRLQECVYSISFFLTASGTTIHRLLPQVPFTKYNIPSINENWKLSNIVFLATSHQTASPSRLIPGFHIKLSNGLAPST